MKRFESLLQFKPTLKRLVAALVICSPVVALTNNLQKPPRAKSAVQSAKPSEIKTPALFPNDRCFGVQPPRF